MAKENEKAGAEKRTVADYACDRCAEAPCICQRCRDCGGTGDYDYHQAPTLGLVGGVCRTCGGTGKDPTYVGVIGYKAR